VSVDTIIDTLTVIVLVGIFVATAVIGIGAISVIRAMRRLDDALLTIDNDLDPEEAS
jgi:hypothetical protein